MDFESLEIWGFGGPSAEPLELASSETTVKPRALYTPESRTLQQCKNEIDLFYEEGKWDDYKKITNPYEYIFLSWNRRSSRSVGTRQPLSRSYFKMIEMWKRLDLTHYLATLVDWDHGLVTAHSAEGPGGFIEACTVLSEKVGWSYKAAHAITLRSEAKNVPGWRKAARFLSSYPQINIHDGEDGTGNILNPENQEAFIFDLMCEHDGVGAHLYTADGGFDFSNDYNAQEDTIFPLLLAEALIGLRVLTQGGCMILKCFDTVERPTLDLIWLLSRAFCEWGIIKPRTSRAGNAERYIIGKGYLGIRQTGDIVDILHKYQAKANFTLPILREINSPAYRPLMAQVAKLQEMVEHIEILVIKDTLDLIKVTDREVIRKLVRENVLRSIAWCKEHDEDISASWTNELDKNVASETSDLLHILHPPGNSVSYSYTTWNKSTTTTQLSFEGFRTGVAMPTVSTITNPFMRLKGKKEVLNANPS